MYSCTTRDLVSCILRWSVSGYLPTCLDWDAMYGLCTTLTENQKNALFQIMLHILH